MADTPFLTKDRNGADVALPTAQAVVDAIETLKPFLDNLEPLLTTIGAAISGTTYYPATQAISVAALPLPAGAATEAKAEAVRALLAGTLAVSAAALPLPAGAATEAKVEAVRALLAGTLAISAAALPLPAGAATDAKVEAVRALLAGTLAVSATALPLPAGAATAARQDADLAQNAAFTGRVALASAVPYAGAAPLRAVEIIATAAGNVAFKFKDGTDGLVPVAIGLTVLPYQVDRIVAAGTTATATFGGLL